jgi:ribosomal protein S18 acetylase RimI-like enzyme
VIAFEGETPVGMANLKIDDERTEIFGLWVATQARGKGVAELLLRELIERAGDRPVWVVVAEPAAAARRLYERLGFEPDGNSGELRPGSAIRTSDLIRAPEPARPATRR